MGWCCPDLFVIISSQYSHLPYDPMKYSMQISNKQYIFQAQSRIEHVCINTFECLPRNIYFRKLLVSNVYFS